MYKLISIIAILAFNSYNTSAQMPPPGFERAKKLQEERNKISPMDRDSVTLTDTVVLFDPETYEQEIRVVSTRMSLRDYCLKVLGIGNPDMLMDGNPHTIIDPKNYEELTVRLNARGKIDTIPR